jgi:hypothetical protein
MADHQSIAEAVAAAISNGPDIMDSPLSPDEAANSEDESMDFQEVRKRKACSPIQTPMKQLITTSNRFDPIAPAPAYSTTASDSRLSSQPSAPPPAFSTNQLRKPATPPIFLKDQSGWTTKNSIIKAACEFPPVCHSTGSAIKIQPTTINDFRAIVRLFTDKKWDYFTYQLPEDKKTFLIIRGLPVDTPIDDIKASFSTKQLFPEEVIQLRTTRPTRAEQERRELILAEDPTATLPALPIRLLPLFQVKINSADDRAKFEAVRSLCDLGVIIEPFKPSPGPPQCKKCQRFGHTHKTCGMPTRCVRCGDLHSHTACPVARPAPATCANCKEHHPANYRGCPAYRSYAQRLQASRRATTAPQAPHLNSAASFPPLPTPPAAAHPAPSPQPTSLQETISSLFTPSVRSKLLSWLSSLIKKLIAPSAKPKTEILLEEIIQGAFLLLSDG